MSEYGVYEEAPRKRNLIKVVVIPFAIAAVVLVGVGVYMLLKGGAPSGAPKDAVPMESQGIGALPTEAPASTDVAASVEKAADIYLTDVAADAQEADFATAKPHAQLVASGGVVYSSNGGAPVPQTPERVASVSSGSTGDAGRSGEGSSGDAGRSGAGSSGDTAAAGGGSAVRSSVEVAATPGPSGAYDVVMPVMNGPAYVPVAGHPGDDSDIVYADDRGTLFHKLGCTELKHTGHPMPYDRALDQRMQPCPRCYFGEYSVNMMAKENETPLHDGKTTYTISSLKVFLSDHDSHYHRGDCARVKYSRVETTFWDAFTRGLTSCPECGSGEYCRIQLGLSKLPDPPVKPAESSGGDGGSGGGTVPTPAPTATPTVSPTVPDPEDPTEE